MIALKKRLLAILLCMFTAASLTTGCTRTGKQTILVESGTSGTYETVSGTVSGTQSGEVTASDAVSGQSASTGTASGKAQNNGTTSGKGTSTGKGNSTGTVSKPKTTHNEGKGDLVVDNLGKDENANYKVEGTVTVAVDTARATDYEALFDALQKAYPKIDLQFDYFMHTTADSAAEYLIAKMQSGKNIPDIIWDEAGSLPTYLAQGYLYPLDSFVKNDADFQYIPKNLIRDYTYCGKLYALPHQIHWEETYINLDVLDALNLKKPSLDWTPEVFADYLNKAASDKRYGGMESMSMIYTMFTNCFDADTTKYGYNPTTRTFDVKGFSNAIKYVITTKTKNKYIDLSSVSNADYIARFGQRVGFTAFNNNKTLFHGVGSWEMADAKERWSNKNWVNWTIPQAKGRNSMPMHVDHSFMLSTCKNPEAAFQVLRFITYSTEGNIARLSMYDKENQGKYALLNDLYYPATNNPKVAEKFNSLPAVGETEKYLFNHIKDSMRFDMIKIVPGWSSFESTYLVGPTNTAVGGAIGNVDGVLSEMASKANTAMKNLWSDFEGKLKKHQAEFAKTHPGA